MTNQEKKFLGAHTSASGGVFNAVKHANDIGATGFSLFVKNQRQWVAKPYTDEVISTFKAMMQSYGFSSSQVLPHAGYLINLGNADCEKRTKSIESFIDELSRCKQLGLTMLNIHPGSHLNEISEAECIELIIESINTVHAAVPEITVVLENTAGQGSNMGYKFEHLRDIIAGVKDKSRIGVCLDSCHTFAAGYDLRTKEAYEETMKAFEDIVGFKYLKGVHLNDSKVKLGSKKDRHESIGKGELGMTFFELFMNDSRFDYIPIALETIESSLWAEEINLLHSLRK